jgi:hypothetical protein
MSPLRSKWACSTLVLPTQSLESKSQGRSALASKLWHKTSDPVQAPWHQYHYQAPWRQASRHRTPQYQAPWSHAPRHLAFQHQRPQQRFVPANHNGKSKIKSKHSKRLQKVEDDQYYMEPHIWMQSMMEWLGQQMKSCQQPPIGRQAWVKKKKEIHPMRGNGRT